MAIPTVSSACTTFFLFFFFFLVAVQRLECYNIFCARPKTRSRVTVLFGLLYNNRSVVQVSSTIQQCLMKICPVDKLYNLITVEIVIIIIMSHY